MHVKIKEVIVVEGKNDTNRLQSFLDCDTIETHGTHVSLQCLAQIRALQKTRGVIVFTDPDYPGERIRAIINQNIEGCKNAFIAKDKAKTSKKVGVEHAAKEDVLHALSKLMTYDTTQQQTLSFADFLSVGLQGQKDSAQKRALIATQLSLGHPNAKTLWKRLNMGQYTLEDIKAILK